MIGGIDILSNALGDIERLSASNIISKTSNVWHGYEPLLMDEKSNGFKANARAVSIGEYIMVVFGDGSQSVQLINTMTDKVAFAKPLSSAVKASSVIKVNNIIYSFGDTKLETLYVIFYFCQYTQHKYHLSPFLVHGRYQ